MVSRLNKNSTTIYDQHYDDEQVSISGVRLPASGAPTWTAYKGGYLLAFAKNADNTVSFTAQLSHRYKVATNIDFHIHVAYPDAGAGNSRWHLTHSWAKENGAFPGETTVSVTLASPEAADTHTVHDIAESIDGTGKTGTSSMLICSLMREGTDGVNDTYDDVIYLVGLDFHIQVDSIGSDGENTKTVY